MVPTIQVFAIVSGLTAEAAAAQACGSAAGSASAAATDSAGAVA
jgi:hypothetical protein